MDPPDSASVRLPPGPYPRIYQLQLGWRIFLWIMGIVLLLGGLGVAMLATLFDAGPYTAARIAVVIPGAGFGVFGSYCILCLLRSRLVLHADRIELRGVVLRKELRRDEIAARRVDRGGEGPATLVLIPKDSKKRNLRIGLMFHADQIFKNWIEPIRDLDAEEAAQAAGARQQSEAALLADPRLGATPQARAAKLARARTLAKVLTGATVIIAGWGLLDPRPYPLVIALLAAIPLIAIVLAATLPKLCRLFGSATDARPSLAVAATAPGVVLGVRAVFDISLLDWPLALAAAVAGVTVVALVLTMIDPWLRAHLRQVPLIAIVALPYTFGVIVLGNVLLDQEPAQMFQAPVLSKRVQTGRPTTWHLNLGPWGTRPAAEEVSVSKALYDEVEVGQSACVFTKSGPVGIPWFVTRHCPHVAAAPPMPSSAPTVADAALDALRRSAESGDARAEHDLAVAYESGRGVVRDDREAARWFRKSAEHGNAQGQYRLGTLYQAGRGVKQDYAQAAEWFQKSEGDVPRAAAALGYLYGLGLGVPQDHEQARQHYEFAARRGDVIGAVNLAVMYTNGRGVSKDFAEAFRWYMVAARQGQLEAMNGVGLSYLRGFGVEQSADKGIAWLTAAAEAGQPNAMHTLGMVYLNGQGRPADDSLAYRWLSLAVRNYTGQSDRADEARTARSRAAGKLTADQLSTIDGVVASWKASPPKVPN